MSFQANKTRPVYRWYKYKEAFSAALVEHLFERYGITAGRILDPFAGSGTALFAASAAGIAADGIELLPIGQQIIATKKLVESALTTDDIGDLQRWVTFETLAILGKPHRPAGIAHHERRIFGTDTGCA